MYDVALVKCDTYEPDAVAQAMEELMDAIGGLDFVKPGMTVAIKANLVSYMKPEAAGTTHPAVLSALVRMLKARGAHVILGDSPGGLYNAAYVNRIYHATGMRDVEACGAVLNDDFSQANASFPEGMVAKDFRYTAYLDKADAIIDCCKLKTHGMMGMSAAAKNMFGVIPGTMKPEYHYRFPNATDFARMIVDLNEYFKPCLSLADAIVGMEGNGPTMGTPRPIGALLASFSPHKLDLACAALIGLTKENVPTLLAAAERGLIPDSVRDLSLYGDLDALVVPDYRNIASRSSILFGKQSSQFFGKAASRFIQVALASRPTLDRVACVRCGKCAEICPAHAITIDAKRGAVIDRDACIRCFCCQEFCPKGAMKVKRPPLARLLNH